jgi:hypothetical protein
MASGPLPITGQAAAQQVKLVKGTLEVLAHEYPLSDILPIRNTGGALTAKFARVNPDDQPAANIRNINSDGQFVYGTMETVTENIQLFHNAIKIDAALQGDKTFLFSPGETQLELVSKNFGREFVNAMINGNPTTQYGVDGNAKPTFEPAGIRYRAMNAAALGSDTGIYTYGITGASIDLSGAITATIANNFLDSVQELQQLTSANVLMMNFRLRTLFTRSFRLGGLLETTQDQIGRTWPMLFGMRVVVPELKAATRILRNTTNTTNWVLPYEDTLGNLTPSAGAGSQFASAMMFNAAEDAFCGLTNSGMIVEGPVKLLPPARAFTYQMEYGLGFMQNGFRDIGMLHGLKIG